MNTTIPLARTRIGAAFLTLSALLLSIAAGCSSDGASSSGGSEGYLDPSLPGPFQVGYATETVVSSVRDRQVPLDVWYPISPDSTGERVTYLLLLHGTALRGGAIDTGGKRSPLVVFSHGSGGVSLQNFLNCEYLASHGYIVAAPSHVGNTLLHSDPKLTSGMLKTRPDDVSATIDWMLTSRYASHIDPDSIGVMGHSFGAYTAIALAGAEAHPARYNPLCDAPNDVVVGCTLVGKFEDPVESVSYRDPRVKASVAVSPAEYEFWGADGLSKVEIPVMVMSGTADVVTPHATQGARIYESLPEPKLLLTFEGVNHLGFTILCTILPEVGKPCFSGGGVDPKMIGASVNRYPTAFFGLYLEHEPRYGEMFSPGPVADVPGLTIQKAP